MPGRKRPTHAVRPAPRFVRRERAVERGAGIGIQIVAAPRQTLGLAVARRVGQGLRRAMGPVQRFLEEPDSTDNGAARAGR